MFNYCEEKEREEEEREEGVLRERERERLNDLLSRKENEVET